NDRESEENRPRRTARGAPSAPGGRARGGPRAVRSDGAAARSHASSRRLPDARCARRRDLRRQGQRSAPTSEQLFPRPRAGREDVRAAGCVKVTVTRTETEALMLEYNLIKRYRPRFNVLLRDDKSYPYIHVDPSEEFPRLSFYRGPRTKKGKLYGPYPSAGAV